MLLGNDGAFALAAREAVVVGGVGDVGSPGDYGLGGKGQGDWGVIERDGDGATGIVGDARFRRRSVKRGRGFVVGGMREGGF